MSTKARRRSSWKKNKETELTLERWMKNPKLEQNFKKRLKIKKTKQKNKSNILPYEKYWTVSFDDYWNEKEKRIMKNPNKGILQLSIIQREIMRFEYEQQQHQ